MAVIASWFGGSSERHRVQATRSLSPNSGSCGEAPGVSERRLHGLRTDEADGQKSCRSTSASTCSTSRCLTSCHTATNGWQQFPFATGEQGHPAFPALRPGFHIRQRRLGVRTLTVPVSHSGPRGGAAPPRLPPHIHACSHRPLQWGGNPRRGPNRPTQLPTGPTDTAVCLGTIIAHSHTTCWRSDSPRRRAYP